MSAEKFYSIIELSELTGVSRGVIYRMARQRKLPVVQTAPNYLMTPQAVEILRDYAARKQG